MSTDTLEHPPENRIDARPSGARRRVAAFLARRGRVRLGIALGPPLGWLLVVYIGALVALLITSLFRLVDDPTGLLTRLDTTLGFNNYRALGLTFSLPYLWEHTVYRNVVGTTLLAAFSVTVIDALLALPVAFYMAKVASPWARRALVVAVTMPLWAGYLVKGYAWKAMLDPASGVLKNVFGFSPGFGGTSAIIVLCYLWFPYMVIPLYAGLERLPNSLLEASTDLGAKAGRTFRSVVFPELLPALAAGSIFTFSLTLGDFYMNNIVGGKNQYIGNIIYRNYSADLPFSAAYAMVPVLIMVIYLFGIRRTGALEEL